MSENGISRRNMIAVAGATVALAGCGGENKGSAPGDPAKVNNIPEPYGLDPNKQAPPEITGLGFNPAYITLIRISGRDAWSLDINHASFGSAGLDRAGRAGLAKRLFLGAQAGNGRRRFGKIPGHGHPNGPPDGIYERPNRPGTYDLPDFDELGAHQQTEIFIWLDSPTVQINPLILISYSPRTEENKDARANDTYFARDAHIPGLAGAVIAIENYYAVFDDTTKAYRARTAADADNIYALNIHYSVPSATGGSKRIPMVIDPTKGNGGGYFP